MRKEFTRRELIHETILSIRKGVEMYQRNKDTDVLYAVKFLVEMEGIINFLYDIVVLNAAKRELLLKICHNLVR